MPDDARNALAQAAKLRLYAAGQWIIEPETAEAGVLVLVRGAMDLVDRRGGEEHLLGVCGAGACVGAESLDTGAFAYAVRAATPAEALWLPHPALRAAIEVHPALRDALMAAAPAGSVPA